MQIKFTVNAIPVAQPRQRHAVVGGHVSNYTPSTHPVNGYKAAVGYSMRSSYNGPVLDCPLAVDIIAVFPRPKSMTKKTKPNNREYKTSKPDVDNIVKSTLDALNGILWRDDALVCDCRIVKVIASENEAAHVKVTVTTI